MCVPSIDPRKILPIEGGIGRYCARGRGESWREE